MKDSAPINKTVGLLLAAGQGSRFGGDKLRYPLENEIPMGVQSALNLKQAVDEVICIVRPHDNVLIQLFSEQGYTIVENPEHQTGLSSSIRAGVKARPDAVYWVIALGDMPYIKAETYQSISQAIDREINQFKSKQKIIRPYLAHADKSEKKQAGHPVAFPNHFKDELTNLSGDKGAAPVIKKANEKIHWLLVEDQGVCFDIDTKNRG